MSSSLVGNGPGFVVLLTNCWLAGPDFSPGMTGFQRVPGASVASNATLRGPTRRSYSGAIALRQLPAAWASSSEVISTSTSFSAWANVAGDTSGPTGGAVPNAGGA